MAIIKYKRIRCYIPNKKNSRMYSMLIEIILYGIIMQLIIFINIYKI